MDKIEAKIKNQNKYSVNTVGGVDHYNGITILETKIMNIEESARFFIIDKDNFKYDILIGLDCIQLFRLNQDYKGIITQTLDNTESHNFTLKSDNTDIKINYNENIPTDQYQVNLDHLTDYEQNDIQNIIQNYRDIFAKDRYDIGTVSKHQAHIKLLNNKYIAKKPYRCSFADQEEIEQQIKKLLEHGLIEQSTSPFAAPVTLAYRREQEGVEKTKNRLCIDFRELNKLIIPESYPFPLIEDLIAKTQGCNWFTTLDINSAFWSIPLQYEDREKTGFITQTGHYHWTCLPFGLKISPAIFQRILYGIIQKYQLTSFCINYLDDILIFSKSFKEHKQHVEKLLLAIRTEGWKLKFVKCSFAQHKTKYLGHIIENGTIKPISDNLKAIKEFPQPKSLKNIRQFLGKVNFYLKFIKDSTKVLEPFHHLLRKDVKFIWDETCEQNFNKIKHYLTSQPILAIFNRNYPIKIYTDASIEGMGAVMKQTQPNGIDQTVAYFSKKFTESQKKKKAIYLESIAVKEAVKFWQYWLLGNKFEIYTDHKPLQNLNIRSRTDEELGDLTNYLSQFDFRIIYLPGNTNIEADCLSRNPIDKTKDETHDILQTVNSLTLEEVKQDQKQITSKTKQMEIKNNVIYKKNTERIVISEQTGKILISRVHKNFGHIGTLCMFNTIRKNYFFKNMTKLIKDHCTQCDICIKNKSRPPLKIGKLGMLGPATKPFEIMSFDTVGGFGGRRSTKRYLHLLIDHFTRYAFISTSSSQTSADFIKLIERVQTENNTKIELLLTDQHGGLTSNEFQNFITSQNIGMIFTSVDCPFSNGLNERLNQTVVNRIRCKVNENEKRKAWTTAAYECIGNYNNTIHSTTKFSPKYLMEGKIEHIIPQQLITKYDLMKDRELALQNTIKAHKINEAKYNKNKIEWEFKPHDLVYVEMNNKLNRNKLDEIRQGPFPITQVLSKHIVEVEINKSKKGKRNYHVIKLIPLNKEIS